MGGRGSRRIMFLVCEAAPRPVGGPGVIAPAILQQCERDRAPRSLKYVGAGAFLDDCKSFLGYFDLRKEAFDHAFVRRRKQIYFDDAVGDGISGAGETGDAFLPESFVTFEISQLEQ